MVMPYQQEISRAHPACILFVLDQSLSMEEGIAGSERPKGDALSRAINRFIRDLIFQCLKGDRPLHRFDVSVIGYCTDEEGRPIVGPAFQGALSNRDIVSVSDLYDYPLREEVKEVDDGDGGLVTRRTPVWYDLKPRGGTPMVQGLRYCYNVAQQWIASHPDSFPPIVIHVTDGEPTDGDPESVADDLRDLKTRDGALLLFNCHLSARADTPLLFPAYEFDIPGEDSQMLFRMSSMLPEPCMRNAASKGYQFDPAARGLVFNGDSTALIQLIHIGTRIDGKLR
jgi:hypothetical protein